MSETLKFYQRSYLLRLQSESFLICVNKKTGDYENIYATDTKEGREYLKEIAKVMTKHIKLLKEEN